MTRLDSTGWKRVAEGPACCTTCSPHTLPLTGGLAKAVASTCPAC
ncbi:MAG: hypothetical protein R3D03_01400 [Geminicoccaceae bacterium]